MSGSTLVTGCGRSGTAFAAAVLTRADLKCSHERTFTGRESDVVVPPFVDASWLAAPFLVKLPAGALVLHQVRSPLLVVGSYVSEGFFRERPRELPALKHFAKRILGRPPSGQYRLIRLVQNALPDVFDEPTEERRAARFWIDWNQLVEQSARRLPVDYRRHRVEDIDSAWLKAVLEHMGRAVTPKVVENALNVSTTTNSRARTVALGLDDLGPLAGEFSDAASRVGYEGIP